MFGNIGRFLRGQPSLLVFDGVLLRQNRLQMSDRPARPFANDVFEHVCQKLVILFHASKAGSERGDRVGGGYDRVDCVQALSSHSSAGGLPKSVSPLLRASARKALPPGRASDMVMQWTDSGLPNLLKKE